MDKVSADDIKKHIIEHEIIGIPAAGPPGPGGSITIIGGYPTYVDTSRGSKVLSINRNTFFASKSGYSNNVYLRVDSGFSTLKSSYRMPRNGTITAASIQTSANSNCSLRIRRNDVAFNLASITLSSTDGGHASNLNADFSESDIIQFYIDGDCEDPVVWIEVAWRF